MLPSDAAAEPFKCDSEEMEETTKVRGQTAEKQELKDELSVGSETQRGRDNNSLRWQKSSRRMCTTCCSTCCMTSSLIHWYNFFFTKTLIFMPINKLYVSIYRFHYITTVPSWSLLSYFFISIINIFFINILLYIDLCVFSQLGVSLFYFSRIL